MRRYLLQVGYCGTRLRGIQKQTEEQERELGSVHGLLERGLRRLRPQPDTISQLYFSSRTDKGVHAVCNTTHVDLSWNENFIYPPNIITCQLNRFFRSVDADIRIHKTRLVPPTFHARHEAVARTYLYRLAVTPKLEAHQLVRQFMPTAEIKKLCLVKPPFDAELVEPACRMLEGVHDFASFANAPSKGSYPRETLREILSITVTPGRPMLDPRHDPLYSQLQFWDVNVRGKSFLYKQVRRTVGVLVAVAQGHLGLQDVQHMLDHPSHNNYKSRAEVLPPEGLFLLDVKYPPHVLDEAESEAQQPPQHQEAETPCGESEKSS